VGAQKKERDIHIPDWPRVSMAVTACFGVIHRVHHLHIFRIISIVNQWDNACCCAFFLDVDYKRE
jgi:hypothetical protein